MYISKFNEEQGCWEGIKSIPRPVESTYKFLWLFDTYDYKSMKEWAIAAVNAAKTIKKENPSFILKVQDVTNGLIWYHGAWSIDTNDLLEDRS